ncbi:hypothetical protein KK083_31945 [Fulvivirgaceae bacterium PWU4]|uniref:Lipoprotein n=1 Tax=Chryseosolibacter histidini TaxID=2782349 RepID=A0AAP2DVL6_9BACT|nr:hypothetical protein [Chryseosolibacter histidini]MBT1701549.1 hypothetical protein [Chryseosolibacter histidini]
MNARTSVVFGFFLLIAAGCGLDSDDPKHQVNISPLSFDFSDSEQDWKHGFADFPSKDSTLFELKYAHTNRPSNLGGGKSIMLSGNNLNGDLFMFLKRKISGLQPDTEFTLTFKVEFASDAKVGMTTANGAPGEDVTVKVGATDTEPKTVIENGRIVMNIDKGDQKSNGEDMIQIGNVASLNTDVTGYSLINLNNSAINGLGDQPLIVRSNSKGELWLVIGTDSEYKGTTTLYYTKVEVFLSGSY